MDDNAASPLRETDDASDPLVISTPNRRPRRQVSRRSYGALDLGTNNCRLLVAVPGRPGQFRVIDAFSRIVRLGEGLEANGRLSDAAMDRALITDKGVSIARATIKGTFIIGLAQGALAGTTPQEAFFVKCDAENNPPDQRANGVLQVEVGVAGPLELSRAEAELSRAKQALAEAQLQAKVIGGDEYAVGSEHLQPVGQRTRWRPQLARDIGEAGGPDEGGHHEAEEDREDRPQAVGALGLHFFPSTAYSSSTIPLP